MRAFLIIVALVSTGLAHAASETTRADFLAALHAARQGHFNPESKKIAGLVGYPLYDYLPAAKLRHDLGAHAGPAVDKKIAAFVEAHPSLPPAERLRGAWLASLAKRRRWSLVVAHTRNSDGTKAQCRALQARIKLGQSPVQDALGYYLKGKSQPSTCDPVFAWLAESGHLPAGTIMKRAHEALLAGHYGLAHYLAGQLSGAAAATVNRWVNLAHHPSQLASAPAGLDGDVAVHVFKRWALSDVDQAAVQLKSLISRFGLSNQQADQMRRYVALLYAEDHRPEALLWFARIDHAHLVGDDHALGWEIRAALYQRRWPLVLDAINSLTAKAAQDEEWRYWKARALAETGQSVQARAIYAQLAGKRSYYGYLAADALNQAYSFNADPLPNNPSALAYVKSRPALARARELHALGMKHYAYLEWRNLISGLNHAQLAQAAKLAYQWQWYARAIVTLAKSDYWDDLDIRYPEPYRAEVQRAAANNDLDPAYVYAIIRTESLFQAAVRSPAGARGLMQLMPATARHLAAALGQPAPRAAQLNDPALNIKLGSRYLRDMLNKWSGNIALATASYNAGPRKIRQWLPDKSTPADIWIANIAYTETRRYVKNVMSHMTVFQHRLSEPVIPLKRRIDAVRVNYPDANRTSF